MVITSRGATIALKGASATETTGVLTLTTGMTRVNVDAGSVLTLSGAGLSKSVGGSVSFSSTGTTNIAGINNTNGIVGGYVTIGNVGTVQQDANGAGNILDFAAVDGSKNIVPFAAYDLNDFTASTKNTKVDGSLGLINLTVASYG